METKKFKHHSLVMLCVIMALNACGALTVYGLLNKATRLYTIATIVIALGFSYFSTLESKPTTTT